MWRFAFILLLAFTCGCVQVQRKPTMMSFDVSKRELIWNKAVVLLQSMNYQITVLDQASGTISTAKASIDPVDCGLLSCAARQSISMTISPIGQIVVNINREIQLPMAKNPDVEWITPHDPDNVSAIEAAQQRIVTEITGVPAVPAKPAI